MKKQKLNFVNSKLDNVPEITLKGDIMGYDGTWIARQINNASDAKRIRIKINSFGGYILEGFEIISAMQLFMNSGGIIETVNVGVADSVAGWIFSNGTRGERKAMQFASGFFHPPLLEDGTRIQDLPEGDETRVSMEDTFDKLINIFVGNTGVNKAKVKSIMEAETDMNAEALVKNGFADEVLKVNNMPKLKNNLTRLQLCNISSSIDYEVINNPKEGIILNKNNKMKNLALLLNLNPEASEGAIKGELEKLVNAKSKAETDLKAVNAKLEKIEGERDSYKEKLETIENKAVTDYVDEVIKLDPKKAENKDSLVNMAKVDFEMFKNMNPLKKVINKGADIADGIEEEAEVAINGKKDALEFVNLPFAKRAELKNSDAEKYNKLVAAYDKYAAEIL